MGRTSSLVAVVEVALAISATACVNNYVVGDDGGASTSMASGDLPGDADGVPTSGMVDGATECTDPDCVTTTAGASSATTADGTQGDGDGDGGGAGDTGLPASGRAPCEPCETDMHCGGEPDLCLDLGGATPVCVARCFEAPPCGSEATCQMVTSVDGQPAMQCVPDAGCPDPGATAGTGAM